MTSSKFTKYELLARVELWALPNILNQVELISLKEIEEQVKELKVDKKIRTKTSKYRKASRYKGSLTGKELIMELMSDGRIHTASEISKMLIEKGFGRKSSSPRISGMVKDGELIMLGDGKYQMAKGK